MRQRREGARDRSQPGAGRPTRGRLVIHGTGDANLDPSSILALREKGYAHAWDGLSGLFARDDLTIVNPEFVVEPGGSIKACLLPAVIVSPGHPVLAQPYAGPCA